MNKEETMTSENIDVSDEPPNQKNVVVLFSGAKDSVFAVYKAISSGYNVKYLLTFIPKYHNSNVFNQPNVNLVELQAKAMGIPLIKKEVSSDSEVEEDIKQVLNSLEDIHGLVVGTIEDREKRVLIEKICEDMGIEFIAPHWQRSMKQYLEEMIFSGFDVVITHVNNEGFSSEWLGRRLDMNALRELHRMSEKYGIHKGGEGDEYGSFVIDGPIFEKRIKILDARKVWNGAKGVYVIDNAVLIDKNQNE